MKLVETHKGNPALIELFESYVEEMLSYVDRTDQKYQAIKAADILSDYWSQEKVWAYLIKVEAKFAGFCLLRKYPTEEDTVDIDQFFVLKCYRRNGIGALALREALARHPGSWLIRVLKTNTTACRFWVDAVEESIGKSYRLIDEQEGRLFIRFTTNPVKIWSGAHSVPVKIDFPARGYVRIK